MSEQPMRLYLRAPAYREPVCPRDISSPLHLKVVSEDGWVELAFIDGTERPAQVFVTLSDFERIAETVHAWGHP